MYNPEAHVDIVVPRIKNAVLDLLGSTIESGRMAFLINHSMGTYIPKTNGQRLIHSLCPLGKDIMRETCLQPARAAVLELLWVPQAATGRCDSPAMCLTGKVEDSEDLTSCPKPRCDQCLCVPWP